MSSPSRMSRPTSPFSGISGDTPEQSPKPEPPASQQVSPIQVASPSVGLSDEQEIDLQTVLSKRFPCFDAISIHKDYDDVAAKQTRFEEGASYLLSSIDAFRALTRHCRNRG